MREKASSVLLLLTGLGLALVGQLYLFSRRTYAWDALLFWAGAIVAFGLLMRRFSRRGRPSGGECEWIAWVHQHFLRVSAAASGVVLALGAGLLARRWPEQADYTVLFALWVIGIVAFSLSCSGFPRLRSRRRSLREWGAWMNERQGLLGGLALLAIVSLGLRALDLEHIPANLSGDEGTWAVEGMAMWNTRLANPFATRWFSFPSMSFLAWGAAMRVFGETVAGVRTLSALIGTATVLTTYALARELWNARLAWLSAIFLAFGHYHLHFSRLAVNNIADGLLVTVALWGLIRGLRRGRSTYFVLSGAALGAGWYGYFGARLIGILVLTYVAWRALVERRFLHRHGRSLLLLVGSVAVVAGPLFLHYIDHPEMLAARSNQVNIFSSGWFAREQEVTGRSPASLLWQQVWRSISAFHYTLDPTFWYRASIPLLDAFSGIFLVLGLMQAVTRRREPSHGLLLLWFGLAISLGWILTENPPSSMRLVIVAPVLALLAAVGLDWFITAGQRILGREGHMVWVGGATLTLVAVAGLNVHYYFTAYTPTCVYGNPTAEVTTRLARDLVELDDRVVYFHGSPFVYWDFGTLRFLARDVEGVDVPPAGEGEPVVAEVSRGARFVFIPERLSELAYVRANYPGGREAVAYSSADGRLLYLVYEIDPLSDASRLSSEGG